MDLNQLLQQLAGSRGLVESLQPLPDDQVRNRSIGRGLINFGQSLATTPGNFGTGLAAAVPSGAGAYMDAREGLEDKNRKMAGDIFQQLLTRQKQEEANAAAMARIDEMERRTGVMENNYNTKNDLAALLNDSLIQRRKDQTENDKARTAGYTQNVGSMVARRAAQTGNDAARTDLYGQNIQSMGDRRAAQTGNDAAKTDISRENMQGLNQYRGAQTQRMGAQTDIAQQRLELDKQRLADNQLKMEREWEREAAKLKGGPADKDRGGLEMRYQEWARRVERDAAGDKQYATAEQQAEIDRNMRARLDTVRRSLGLDAPKAGLETDVRMGQPAATRSAAPAPAGNVPQPKSRADFDALPSGTRFMDPSGQIRVKP